ncbi:MAG: MucR family transcriptional regulator [Desulfobulbaceae bacterium]|nr:MucR family transcriptional regulator [Desulfobulbaceae bacterium]HIJ89825.1 MucR family transcriptional regulator [Deltaproteobacteria bacterium]
MGKSLVEMAADLVQSQCASKGMNTEEITLALQATFNALQMLQAGEAKMQTGVSEGTAGAVAAPSTSPEKSIQKNKIICLECGQEFKMLSPKHLRSHDLTGREYREKWGFSLRQPLCAKALSERRKKAGKDRGLPDNLRKAIAKRKKNGQAKKAAAEKK